jgi:hypothetical protein
MYTHELEVYIGEYQSFLEDYYTTNFSMFLIIVEIVTAVSLIGTLLVLLGAFSTASFQILNCRKMVHIGWLIYSCSFIGGLILMYLFIGLGSIGYGFCQYYDGLLKGTDVFQKIQASNSQNVINRIKTCMYGNGNTLESFGVANEV